MRRVVFGGLLVLLTCFSGIRDASAAEKPRLRAPRVAVGPVIDGVLSDACWSDAWQTIDQPDHLHPSYRDAWTGPNDLSARVQAVVVEHDLYLAFSIRDEALVHAPGRDWWIGDTIELFFDTDLVSDEPRDRFTEDDLQLFLIPFQGGQRWGVVGRDPSRPFGTGGLHGIEVAHRAVEGGYELEARIPLFNLRPLRPDASGAIGFDIAINDLDDPASTRPESYLTWSGRFDLYREPSHFGRLTLPSLAAPASTPPARRPWLLFLIGGTCFFAAAWVALRALPRMEAWTRRTRLALTLALAALALVALLAPYLADSLDRTWTRAAAEPDLDRAARVVQACLDVDSGPPAQRGRRALTLLRDGSVRIRAPHRYATVPTTVAPPLATDAPLPSNRAYRIPLGPGATRTFPLEGRTAPARLRCDLESREAATRAQAGELVAEITIAFDEGPPTRVQLTREQLTPAIVALGTERTKKLASLTVRNLHPFRELALHALWSETADGSWAAMPLPTLSPAGIPLDVWHGTPTGAIVSLTGSTTTAIQVTPRAADQLWIAVSADGAYPRTAYGALCATVRALDASGETLAALELRNGRDCVDPKLSLLADGESDERLAMEWIRSGIIPARYTLHTLPLDPARPLDRLVVETHGVLTQLDVAAVTLGRRMPTPQALAAELTLDGDLLSVRAEAQPSMRGLHFRLQTPDGVVGAAAVVKSDAWEGRALSFRTDGMGTLEVALPRSAWAVTLEQNRALVFGLAAFLAALVAVLVGALMLGRARKLRVKMLITLGAATVVPLGFLVYFLVGTLQQDAEAEQENATRFALVTARQHIQAQLASVRELAVATRDSLELLVRSGERDTDRWIERQRVALAGGQAFLRTLGLTRNAEPELQNRAFLGAVRRSGLYYSAWDGLMAIGLAPGSKDRVCTVGLRSDALLPPPTKTTRTILFAPTGEPLAGAVPNALRTPQAVAELETRARAMRRQGVAPYDARTWLDGKPVSLALELVRDGDRVVGMLGAYRSRVETERAQAAAMRTVLLAGLAALLLVVVAGGFLVERVTDRLQRVTRAANAVAQGEWSSRVPVEGVDELGRLAQSFNTMADALNERARAVESLHQGMHELTASLDPREVARTAAELLVRATGATHVALYAMERATSRLDPLHVIGSGAPLGTRLPQDGPVVNALATRTSVTAAGRLFVPLAVADRAVGIAVCSPLREGTPVDHDALNATARQIAIALENARLYRVAVTDEVTGLYTMDYFMRRLREEVDRAAVSKRPLAVARIAIRDFDEFVRQEGTAVAHRYAGAIARTIADRLPSRDLLAHRRAGEWMLLTPEREPEQAQRLLHRLHEAVTQRAAELAGDDPAPMIATARVHFPQDGAAADILLDTLDAKAVQAGARPTDEALPAELGMVLGKSPTMRAVLEVVARVAPTNATVLVGGETGSGKEVIADLIQANSDRAQKPYIKVNCAAIPESLIESELFGHEKGAFTGAQRRRIGRFEAAHTGTLFLDEIGELPSALQTKLLRVLQEREFERVGSTTPIAVDVRIVTATNRALADLVRRGEFREDLYHRLHVVEVRVPPLRERREEIPHLVERFRQEFNQQHSLRVAAFAPDALDLLYRHVWPGNVRELRNVVERAMLLAPGVTVEGRHLDMGSSAPAAHPTAVEGLTVRQEAILAYARAHGGVSNSDVVRDHRVSARTALRELNRLVERGILVRVGRRRGAIYRTPRA